MQKKQKTGRLNRSLCDVFRPIHIEEIIFQKALPDAFFSILASYRAIVLRDAFSSGFVLPALNAAPTALKSDNIADQNSGAVLANGINFNGPTKILIAETS